MNKTASSNLLDHGYETASLKLIPHWKITFAAPTQDIDRIFEKISSEVELVHGKTDHNAYLHGVGHEYYRPLEGTPTGSEEKTRKRPGVNQMHVVIPQEKDQLDNVIEAIFSVHSYYEPSIYIESILRSQTKGIDDSDNPHRWWNTSGDWKKQIEDTFE